MQNRLYTEEEARQILIESIDRQSQLPLEKGVSAQQLQKMAEELGVSEEALQATLSQWQVKEAQDQALLAEKAERAEFRTHTLADWGGHLTAYVLVNLMLVIINLMTSRHHFWALYSILGWGIGMGIHTYYAFVGSGEEYEEEFQKWRKKRRKKQKE